MPIETDSGYLPDWLAALIGQGRMAGNVPTGLFSDTSASPSPAVGLLSSLPQFTGVRPDAPAFQGGNAPNGPLPDPAATFTYMNPTPPWGGSGPSNSYPSMTMPQDPGPMNIGPGGAAPSFTGVNPNAPFTANGPNSVQDQYANVPLPPRRPTSLTDFQAQSAEDPADINTPPPGRPNANVVGTEASGAPEVTAQQPLGFGDYLGKAANAIGSIYGAGGPGDALIALGLSNRTNGASIQALNAMNANRTNDVKLQLLKNQLALQNAQQNATYKYFISKGVPPEEAQAATLDPNLAKKKFEEFAGASNYTTMTDPVTNNVYRVSNTDPTDRQLVFKGAPDLPKQIGEGPLGEKVYGYRDSKGNLVRTDENGKPMAPGDTSTGAFGAGLPGAEVINEGPDVNIPGRNEEYLKTLSPGMAAHVKAISEGREPFPTGLRSQASSALQNALNEYDKNFDYTNAQARNATRLDFARGKTADSITTGNTVIGHMGHMSDWAEKLAESNTSIPMFNQWKNNFAVARGGGLPALNYDQWADLIGREATRFYSPGGGTEAERAAISERLKSAGSPDQLRSAIKTVSDAIESKVTALQDRWHAGMESKPGITVPDYPILTPSSQSTLAKINDRVSKVEGGTASGGTSEGTVDTSKFPTWRRLGVQM